MPTVEIILKEKIANLGAEGDVVNVKGGYARNFLLPQGKAFEATKSNLRKRENLQRSRAEREAKELDEATKLATKLKRLKLKLSLATGQGGKAFGSITITDIIKAVEDSSAKVTLDKHQIELEKPIKSTGVFEIPVKLHAEVSCFLKLTVAAADDSAADESDDDSAE